jgi:hypothetical protein
VNVVVVKRLRTDSFMDIIIGGKKVGRGIRKN